LVIFNEKDGRYGGKSIFLKGQVIVSPFLKKKFQKNIRSEKPKNQSARNLKSEAKNMISVRSRTTITKTGNRFFPKTILHN
jgi:hypothetical protein